MRRVEMLTRINTGILVFFVVMLVAVAQPQIDQLGGLFDQIP
jgi:hypothetical protein